MATNSCSALQRSLAWCQGTPELPGVKRRVYYLAKSEIVGWPTLVRDAHGRAMSAVLVGSFALKADTKWHYIDILPDKSQLTSEAQGELPSQTQLNKLTAVHPGVGPEAAAAAAYLNNTDSVFLVEDMKGNFRVVGSDRWLSKTTVAQDLGQGATGTTSTTISVEATDEVPAPFYNGIIETEDGDIDLSAGLTPVKPTSPGGQVTNGWEKVSAVSESVVVASGSKGFTLKIEETSDLSRGDTIKLQCVNSDGVSEDIEFTIGLVNSGDNGKELGVNVPTTVSSLLRIAEGTPVYKKAA